jgi:hypothetical protein
MPTRRVYAGGAAAQPTTTSMTTISASVGIADNAGWPTGGPFAVVIDRGLSTEEKCLVSNQSSNTLNFATRGYDGSGAQAHSSGAIVELCITAVDLDEANAHTSASTGVHGGVSKVATVGDIETFTNKTLVQPVIGDFTNANHDHSSTVEGGALGVTHSGTVSLTPGSATVVWAHGAPFTPSAAAVFISAYSGQTYISYYVNQLDATNIGLNFAITTSSAAIVTSCTIRYTVFA